MLKPARILMLLVFHLQRISVFHQPIPTIPHYVNDCRLKVHSLSGLGFCLFVGSLGARR